MACSAPDSYKWQSQDLDEIPTVFFSLCGTVLNRSRITSHRYKKRKAFDFIM